MGLLCFSSSVTGSHGSFYPPAIFPGATASRGTAPSPGETPWPSDHYYRHQRGWLSPAEVSSSGVQTFDLEKAASYCEHLVISYKTLRHQRTFDWRQKGAAGQRRFQPEPVSAFRLQQLNKECYTKAFFFPPQL